MDKKTIIASLIEIANELDDANLFDEADHLTKIAWDYDTHRDELIRKDRNVGYNTPPSPKEYPEPAEKDILQKSVIILKNKLDDDIPDLEKRNIIRMIVEEDIPDEIWEEATQVIIDESADRAARRDEFEPETREYFPQMFGKNFDKEF